MTDLQTWLSDHLNKVIDNVIGGGIVNKHRILSYYLDYLKGCIIIEDYELSFPVMDPAGNENADVDHLWKVMHSSIKTVEKELEREGWDIQIDGRHPLSTHFGEIWCSCSRLDNYADNAPEKRGRRVNRCGIL